MPIGAQVIAGDALARGLSSVFSETWRKRYEADRAALSPVMAFGVPGQGLYSPLFGYFESAPYPRRVPFGQSSPSVPFRARNYTVSQLRWAVDVKWQAEDRKFDQLGKLQSMARQAGTNFGTLAERVFFQILTATADTLLLPAIPNAPDGAALFSGAARFGVATGNIVTGTGIATAQAIREDFFNAIELFSRFQDPQGQPALPRDAHRQGVTVFYNVVNEQVFREAFVQGRPIQFLAGVDATSPRGVAAVTNVIMDSGQEVRLWPTQRITDNDYVVALNGYDTKPIFEVVETELEENVQVPENSDISRSTREEGIFYNSIRTYGVNLPLGIVQVNN